MTEGTDSRRHVLVRLWKDPLFRRILVVAAVVAGLYLALAMARVFGFVDPTLWDVLEEPLSNGAQNTVLFSVTVIALGNGIGFLAGWARVSRHLIGRAHV